MPLSRQSVGIYQETNLHATRQGKLSYSRLSWLSHCGLILWTKELKGGFFSFTPQLVHADDIVLTPQM